LAKLIIAQNTWGGQEVDGPVPPTADDSDASFFLLVVFLFFLLDKNV